MWGSWSLKMQRLGRIMELEDAEVGKDYGA